MRLVDGTAVVRAAGSGWEVHRAHMTLLGAWVVVFGLCLVRARWGARKATVRSPWVGRNIAQRSERTLLRTCALASVASATVHLSIVREHFAESAVYGLFFLALCAVQFGWAAWLVLCPSVPMLVVGMANSLLVVLLWLATRTVAIPLGPAAGTTEGFGWRDVAASAGEIAVVLLGALALVRVSRRTSPKAPQAEVLRLPSAG